MRSGPGAPHPDTSNLQRHTQPYQKWDRRATPRNIKPAKAHPAQTYQKRDGDTTPRHIKPAEAHPARTYIFNMGQAHHNQTHQTCRGTPPTKPTRYGTGTPHPDTSNLQRHTPTQTYQTWDRHTTTKHIKPAEAHPNTPTRNGTCTPPRCTKLA